MPHWKSMVDREFMFAFDLNGKDVTVTIEKVTAGEIVGQKGKKSKKPMCFFKEGREKKPLALNATNCKLIAGMYGNDTDNWIGKRVTLYPTQTEMGGETVDCIRVRPRVPPERAARPEQPEPEAPSAADERQPGDD